MSNASLGFVIRVADRRLSVSQHGLHQQTHAGAGGEVCFLSDLPLPDLEKTAEAVLESGALALRDMPGGILTFAIRTGSDGTEVIAARDVVGLLPLYAVSTEEGRQVFLSSLRHIRQVGHDHPLRVDKDAVPEYLLYRQVVGPRTLFEGVSAPLPGHAIVKQGRESRHVPYFDLPATFKRTSADGVAEKVSSSLHASIVREIDGKRGGLMFSGGLDSSWLAYAKPDLGMALYTISFPGSESDLRSALNEASFLQREIRSVRLEREGYARQLPAAIAASGLPIDHPNYVGRRALFTQAAQDGMDRLIGGDGADSIFGGSWHDSVYKALTLKRFVPALIGRLPLPGRRGVQVKRILGSDLHDLVISDSYYPPEVASRFVRGHLDPRIPLRDLVGSLHGMSPLDRAFFMSLVRSSGDSAVQTALAWSAGVGLGYPYQTREIVELANGVAGEQKLSGFKPKALLVDACRRDVPARIINRKKSGLPIPLRDFILGDGGLLRYRDLLLGSDCMSDSILDLSELGAIFKRFDDNEPEASDLEFFWVLLNLELWLRIMVRGESIE